MLKMKHTYSSQDIDSNWRDHCVMIWQEDDALVPDKEHTNNAFERISALSLTSMPFHEIDEIDQFVYFYSGGWVRVINYEGGWVGIMIEEKA